MKTRSIILFLFAALSAQGQPAPLAKSIVWVDSLENQAIAFTNRKNDSVIEVIGRCTSLALAESQRIGYTHGIAVGLACQAFLTNMTANDFPRSEQLARESLDQFGKTDNKSAITLAYYALGFSLFAQSRFDEAVHDYDQARIYARQSGNQVQEIYMLSLTGEAYRERGDYEKAFDLLRQCIQLAQDIHDTSLVQEQDFALAGLFVQIEDYHSAEKYFMLGFGSRRPESQNAWNMLNYAELLTHQHKYDSARYFYDHFDSAHAWPATLRTYLVSKGEYYMVKEDYATALPYLLRSLDYQRQLNDRNQMMRCLHDLSKTYQRLHRDKDAFRTSRELLAMAEQSNARQYIRDGSQDLYTLYDQSLQTDSAYWYYRRYILMKDSVLNDQVKGKFASYGFEQQIKWLKQEKELQDVCIRDQDMTKRFLIGGIMVLLLIGFIYFRYIRLKRKNEVYLRQRAESELEIQRLEGERAKATLQQQAKELEIQALRSQMNPHFIFNCLNAINFFILNHETEAASDYLTKFSRLMRMIMNHSRHSFITLAEELEVLQLYLDMERLRFKNAFDYHILPDEDLDAEDIHIPPLLLQPFVENAVWHGLMHKQERGSLYIRLRLNGNLLTCIIEDNGIGRKQAALLKSKSVEKHKSMGLQITAARMALLSGPGESGHFFRIEDLYDEEGQATGTKVILTIRVDHSMEELAGALI